MKHIFLVTALGSSAMVLTACGGASTSASPPIALPAATITGTTPTAYDPAAGTLIVNGMAITNPRNTEVVSNGDASVYGNTGLTDYSAIARSGDVFAIATAADTGGTDLRGFNYGRLAATALPTTGSATFSGDYAGTLIANATGAGTQNVFRIIDGDVALAVDFADSALTGSITNRQGYSMTGVLSAADSYADAMMTNGTIAANGSFAATVTGGERSGYTYVGGAANGVFGGATGDAAAGVVKINQTFGALERTEIGAFTATQD